MVLNNLIPYFSRTSHVDIDSILCDQLREELQKEIDEEFIKSLKNNEVIARHIARTAVVDEQNKPDVDEIDRLF